MTTNTWGSIAADVAKAAPLLGNLIPGIGTVAGVAIGGVASIISSALGVPADPDSVATALANDPDAYVKLKQAEMDNAVALGNLALQKDQQAAAAVTAQYSAEAADRASARTMAIQTKDWFTKVLAIAVTLGFFGTLALLCFTVIPEANKPVLYIMIGSLGTAWATVMAFYYGTTQSSTVHSANLNDQMSKITDFAVSPGSVTSGSAAQDTTSTVTVQSSPPVTVTNNSAPSDPSLYRGS